MKIAMPALNGRLNPHFGSSPTFRIVEVDETAKAILISQDIAVTHDGCGGIPALLKSHGVSLVIAGGIGQGAVANLARQGIALVAGAPSAACEQVVTSYLTGTLQVGPNACQGHQHGHAGGCHGHQHRHGAGHACQQQASPGATV